MRRRMPGPGRACVARGVVKRSCHARSWVVGRIASTLCYCQSRAVSCLLHGQTPFHGHAHADSIAVLRFVLASPSTGRTGLAWDTRTVIRSIISFGVGDSQRSESDYRGRCNLRYVTDHRGPPCGGRRTPHQDRARAGTRRRVASEGEGPRRGRRPPGAGRPTPSSPGRRLRGARDRQRPAARRLRPYPTGDRISMMPHVLFCSVLITRTLPDTPHTFVSRCSGSALHPVGCASPRPVEWIPTAPPPYCGGLSR